MPSSVNAINATELTPKNMQIMKIVCSMLALLRLPAIFRDYWSLDRRIIAIADSAALRAGNFDEKCVTFTFFFHYNVTHGKNQDFHAEPAH